MPVTDPIADLLTRIRNAIMANRKVVDCPRSRIKEQIVDVMTREKFLRGYKVVEDGPQGTIRIALNYGQDGRNVISGIKRISKPGLRQYRDVSGLPRVKNNLGIAILSTPEGILTNKEARRRNIGGEVLCYIW